MLSTNFLGTIVSNDFSYTNITSSLIFLNEFHCSFWPNWICRIRTRRLFYRIKSQNSNYLDICLPFSCWQSSVSEQYCLQIGDRLCRRWENVCSWRYWYKQDYRFAYENDKRKPCLFTSRVFSTISLDCSYRFLVEIWPFKNWFASCKLLW